MQTFLPDQDFAKSAMYLDPLRLNKQILETKQILTTLTGQSDGWKHHPAVKMWKNNTWLLAIYGLAMCRERQKRRLEENRDLWFRRFILLNRPNLTTLWWMERSEFFQHHRATLLYKNYGWYSKFGWTEQPRYCYLWPTDQEGVFKQTDAKNIKELDQIVQ